MTRLYRQNAPFILLLILGFSKFGVAQISLSAEIRPRFEFRNGFKELRPKNDFNPAAFVEQRTRLYLGYQRNQLKIKISVQDIRMWGNHDQIYKTDNNIFNIYEGYAEYWFKPKWAFKVGRQAIGYDNERFFGFLGWAQQSRSHDALLIKFKSQKDVILDLGLAVNNSGTEPNYLANAYYARNNYKNMQFAYLQKKWTKTTISLIAQNEGRQNQDTSTSVTNINYSQTFGITGKGHFSKNWNWVSEFYFQTGVNGINQNIEAFMFTFSTQINTKITPLTWGIDYLSGTQKGATENRSFDPRYGTNHGYYGTMDYFYVGNFHGQQGRVTGLTDLYFKTKFKLSKLQNLKIDYHYFLSPVSIYQTNNFGGLTNTELSPTLGQEIDFTYEYNLAPDVVLNAGYSHMFATNTMEAVKNFSGSKDAMNNWFWIMITIKPNLLPKKKESL